MFICILLKTVCLFHELAYGLGWGFGVVLSSLCNLSWRRKQANKKNKTVSSTNSPRKSKEVRTLALFFCCTEINLR